MMTTPTESRKIGNSSVFSSPFVCLEGQWYVVIQWRPDEPIGDILTLRPLTKAEQAWLEPQLTNAHADVWARLYPTDQSIMEGAVIPDDG